MSITLHVCFAALHACMCYICRRATDHNATVKYGCFVHALLDMQSAITQTRYGSGTKVLLIGE